MRFLTIMLCMFLFACEDVNPKDTPTTQPSTVQSNSGYELEAYIFTDTPLYGILALDRPQLKHPGIIKIKVKTDTLVIRGFFYSHSYVFVGETKYGPRTFELWSDYPQRVTELDNLINVGDEISIELGGREFTTIKSDDNTIQLGAGYYNYIVEINGKKVKLPN